MQHRIKGRLPYAEPDAWLSVRVSDPRAAKLWFEGHSMRTSVGRWAVVWAMPGSADPDGSWQVYPSICVARMTSRSQAVAYARYRRSLRFDKQGPYFRARIVRWRRWMRYPEGPAYIDDEQHHALHQRFVDASIERTKRLYQLLGIR